MNQSRGRGKRDQEGRARGPLLEREDQPADRGNVVIGRRGEAALRGRAGGALACARIDVAAWARRSGPAPRRIPPGVSPRPSPRAAWAAPRVSARRRPSRFRCSALSRSAREVRFGSRGPAQALRRACHLGTGSSHRGAFVPWPPLPRFQTSLALAPSRVPRNRRKLMREFARLATRDPPAAARSVIEKWPLNPDKR